MQEAWVDQTCNNKEDLIIKIREENNSIKGTRIINKEDRIEDMGASQVVKSISLTATNDSKCLCLVDQNRVATKRWTLQIFLLLVPLPLDLRLEAKKWSIKPKNRVEKTLIMPRLRLKASLETRQVAHSNAKGDRCLCNHFSQTQFK